MVSRSPVTTLSKYDEMLAQQDKLSVNNSRPLSSVVHTIGQPDRLGRSSFQELRKNVKKVFLIKNAGER